MGRRNFFALFRSMRWAWFGALVVCLKREPEIWGREKRKEQTENLKSQIQGSSVRKIKFRIKEYNIEVGIIVANPPST